jgi:hypothetical protein
MPYRSSAATFRNDSNRYGFFGRFIEESFSASSGLIPEVLPHRNKVSVYPSLSVLHTVFG